MKAARQSRVRGLFKGLSTIFLTLCLISGMVVAEEGGDPPLGGGGMFGGGSSGGIGTIPSTHSGVSGLPQPNTSGWVPAPMGALKPALRLVGTKAELDAVVSSTFSPDGSGWFEEKPLKGNKGRVSYTIYGNVLVELDRAVFRTSRVLVQVEVGPSFAGGVAVLKTAGGRSAIQSLSTGPMNLKLHRTVESGLADDGLQLLTRSTTGAKAFLRITGEARTIRLQQSH